MKRTKHKQAHTQFARGQKVLVVLKDDTRFVGKFIEKLNHVIVFEGRRQPIAGIQSATIYKHIERVNKPSRAEIASKVEAELKTALGSDYCPAVLEKVIGQMDQIKKKQKNKKQKGRK